MSRMRAPTSIRTPWPGPLGIDPGGVLGEDRTGWLDQVSDLGRLVRSASLYRVSSSLMPNAACRSAPPAEEIGSQRDSPLEEAGFELLVPQINPARRC